MQNGNIIYLFGAGASRNSVPIVNDFSKEMVNLNEYYYKIRNSLNVDKFEPLDNMIDFIGQKGAESVKYGSIDNWAHILHRNGNYRAFEELKFSLSLFLAVWQQLNTKISEANYPLRVDPRYVKLLPYITNTSSSFTWNLKPEIKLASWNYDNQIEFGLSMLHKDTPSLDDLKRSVKFSIENINGPDSYFDLLHLNGYCGFHGRSGAPNKLFHEIPFFHEDNLEPAAVFEDAARVFAAFRRGDIDIKNHIHYGFESRDSINGFDELKTAFGEASYVIVIGYTFPDFNLKYDKALFSELGLKRKAHIIIQDPRPEIPMRKLKSYMSKNEQNYSISSYSHVSDFLLPNEVYSEFWQA